MHMPSIKNKNCPTRDDIRNLAIIAYVDHGKTTLVDAMLQQSHTFRANQEWSDHEDHGDFPVLYAAGREGIAKMPLDGDSEDLQPLFDTIIESVPPPRADPAAPLQMLVTNIDYNDYVGRLAIGRVVHGKIC